MFEAIENAKPGFLTLPSQGLSISWFISTVLLTSLGFYMYPHSFGAIYAGKSEKTFRKNTIIMPLYQLILLFVFFAGFAAILQIPGLMGDEVDLSLLRLSKLAFDPWVMGVIGAAGVLTALVPGSMLLMSAATLLAKNVYGVFVPSATDKQIVSLAKYLVPVVALASLFFTFKSGTIVALLLMGSSMVTQLFPAMIFSLMRNNFVTKQGAFAGIIMGEATVAYITLSKTTIGTLFPLLPHWVKDI
ncbi:Na+/proline symporter [Neobacillus ginsengisoli]|uniref:Na+/proline symporter n=1 Tax=Neobacillus ginsengisoli TaxID=904295 RepID=A0ABT9Y0D6_9BACI|nr:Na+/proline symporter [Neobacillus ginsengisoli]